MSRSSGMIPMDHAIQSPALDFSSPVDASTLKGRVIVITGGASGFGAAFLSAWAASGATVIIGDINERAGQALIESTKLSTGNDNLHFRKLDVTVWESQVSFFRDASSLSQHGGIDCVVANAGIGGLRESAVIENPPDYASMKNPSAPELQTIDVNLIGVLYTIALAQSYLTRNPKSSRCSITGGGGPRDRHILLVASVAGLMALPSQPVYVASKHAVVGLFRSLRVTYPIAHGIRVNMLCPYYVDTPILGLDGAIGLSGGAMAKIESVVDAATRLVADTGIIGRGLAIGPKASIDDATVAGFDDSGTHTCERAVWDVYAHDFEQSDLSTRRVIAITNLKSGQRGVVGLFGDLGWAFTSPVRRFFGF